MRSVFLVLPFTHRIMNVHRLGFVEKIPPASSSLARNAHVLLVYAPLSSSVRPSLWHFLNKAIGLFNKAPHLGSLFLLFLVFSSTANASIIEIFAKGSASKNYLSSDSYTVSVSVSTG